MTRGTSQNPDVYLQARESVNPFYRRAPELMGSGCDTAHEAVEALTSGGEEVGVLKVRPVFRPLDAVGLVGALRSTTAHWQGP